MDWDTVVFIIAQVVAIVGVLVARRSQNLGRRPQLPDSTSGSCGDRDTLDLRPKGDHLANTDQDVHSHQHPTGSSHRPSSTYSRVNLVDDAERRKVGRVAPDPRKPPKPR